MSYIVAGVAGAEELLVPFEVGVDTLSVDVEKRVRPLRYVCIQYRQGDTRCMR